MSEVTVRVLGGSEAPAYNDFFARGAAEHADTLRISPADIAEAPFETDLGAEGSSFVAQDEARRWLGVVTVQREAGRQKRRHIAWLLRMYVAAESSGKGVGRALLAAAVARARELPGVEKVNLTVAAHNARAVGLYESVGFEVFSHEADAFRDGEPRSELTMALRL
jgi:ribosomal protein S18 acetylase RimI-like enzyme